tara:strand:- start:25 stop:249 length:225 start_codon:yes stop_codon:yes gene_type:complete
MGSLFRPKMPPVPQMTPPPEPDFSADDEAMKKQAEEDEKRAALRRKGRRATILTGTGLADIAEEDLNKKTLLGG